MFVFIIDNLMSWDGTISALDASKHAVESFLATAPCLGASLRLMLLQTGQGDDCLLSSFGDPVSVFREGLKNIPQKERAHGSDATNFTYPISYALSVVNRHRMKSGTDTFGHGRAMWLIEPVNIIVFSDCKGEAGKNEVRLRCPDSCWFAGPPLRWDHRISYVMVSRDQPALPKDVANAGSLAALCKTSQGEIMQIRDMKEATSVLRAFSPRIGPYRSLLTVGINLKTANAAGQLVQNKGEDGVVAARLIPSDSAPPEGFIGVRWPVPESFWVDMGVDKFPPRETFPVLTVTRVAPPQVEIGGGGGEVVGSPDYFLALAKELRIYVEAFELAPPPNAPLSVKKALGIKSQEKCHVSAQGSGRPSTVDNSASVGSALLASQANSKANAINGIGLTVPPFAILLPNSRTPGSCELRMLPFNYPIFLPMVHRALEAIKKCQALQVPNSQLFTQPWTIAYQAELQAYLHTVPSYAYPAVFEVLRILGLKPQPREDKIHKTPFKKIQALKGAAIVEIASLQAAARRKWPAFVPSPIEVAIASCEPGRRVVLPQAASKVAPKDMLSVYDRMRGVVFGGCEGWAASRLGVAGTQQQWVVAAIGGGSSCQLSVADMGNFYEVLARKEALRDPLMLGAAPSDEDTPEGLMNRKTKVNFGNRFKGGEGDGMALGGMEIETNTGVRIVGIDDEEEGPPLDAHPDDPTSYFLNTPFPAVEESEDEDIMCYSPLTDRESDCDRSRDCEDWSQIFDEVSRPLSSSSGIADVADPQPRTQRKLSLSPALEGPSPILALPPLGRPFAALNGKRKRDAEKATPASSVVSLLGNDGAAHKGDNSASSSGDSIAGNIDVDNVTPNRHSQAAASEAPRASLVSDSTSPPPIVAEVAAVAPAALSPPPADQLPPCWVQKFSEKHQTDYWFNLTNGQSVWQRPKS